MKEPNKTSNWQRISNFFESGDLVPFAVIVSSVHFITALVVYGGESWPVAVLVGIFVDMLHYRTIRYAVRGRGRAAVILAAITTVMSYVFHLLFYIDGGAFEWVYLLLAVPLPFGIFILAWQQEQARSESIQDDMIATVVSERNKAVSERDAAVLERDKLTADLAKMQKRLDKGVVTLDKLPVRLADYVTAVANGVTPDGDFTTKHGVGESTLDRTNRMFLRE